MKKKLNQFPLCKIKHSQNSGKNKGYRTHFHPILTEHGDVGLSELARRVAFFFHLDTDLAYRLLMSSLEIGRDCIFQGYSLNLPFLGKFKLQLHFTKPVMTRAELATAVVEPISIAHRLPNGQRDQLKTIPVKINPNQKLRLNEDERFAQIIYLFKQQTTVTIDEVMQLNETTRNVASRDLHKLARKGVLHFEGHDPVAHWSYIHNAKF